MPKVRAASGEARHADAADVPAEGACTDDAFRSFVRAEGVRLYRDLPWRNTRDPYVIWLSEVMLQQTQVARVEKRMPAWLDRFPTVEALAASSTADVLVAWQGMGYNRRALALKAAAEKIVDEHDGVFPRDAAALKALPGIGPATAQGIRAFAFDLPGVYLETNVRSVFLHHFFPDAVGVPDKELVPLIERTCPDAPAQGAGHGADAVSRHGGGSDAAAGKRAAGMAASASHAAGEALAEPASAEDSGLYAVPQDERDTPRSWYYALLDYGAHLKQVMPNPSRRSGAYTRQSAFEGSYRQKRSCIVKALLAAREDVAVAGGDGGSDVPELLAAVNAMERAAKRPDVDEVLVEEILGKLSAEGFCREICGRWFIS